MYKMISLYIFNEKIDGLCGGAIIISASEGRYLIDNLQRIINEGGGDRLYDILNTKITLYSIFESIYVSHDFSDHERAIISNILGGTTVGNYYFLDQLYSIVDSANLSEENEEDEEEDYEDDDENEDEN